MDGFENTNNFDVEFGIRKKTHERAELETGLQQLFHCSEPFLLKITDGVLLLSMQLYDVEGNPNGEIKNNALLKSASSTYKINYDDKAIEVVNEHNITAIRVELQAPDKIILSGAVKCDPEVIISCPEITRQLPTNNAENEATLVRLYGQRWIDFYMAEGVKIGQVFEYTGTDYLGKRAKLEKRVPEETPNHSMNK
jgi:hypothetical protein